MNRKARHVVMINDSGQGKNGDGDKGRRRNDAHPAVDSAGGVEAILVVEIRGDDHFD